MTSAHEGSGTHTVAIVIPVYNGEKVLGRLFDEIVGIAPDADCVVTTPDGHTLTISEIVLVHDCGPDDSARVIRGLADRDPRVRPIWLSRNFGQHAATLAGIATTASEWVVTMDEDGQHDPADLPRLLDVALATGSQLVYARGVNNAPHGWWRNTASAFVKWVADHLVASEGMGDFSSYRLILGEVGRAISAFGGHDVYLDVALTWVARPSQVCRVRLRSEDRASGYSARGLVSHLGRLLLTSGVRPLRLITLIGSLVALAGFVFAGYAIFMRLTQGVVSQGFTSVIVAVLVMGGLLLVSLGIMAEYLAVVVGMAMGRPSYLLVADPAKGPLGRVGQTAPIESPNDARQQ